MRNTETLAKMPSRLEQLVLDFLSGHGPLSAEGVREGMKARHPMKEATARTILRRLEAKGYVTHTEQDRTYIYSCVHPASVGVRSIRQLIDRFWGGSAKALVAGMIEHEVIDPAELRALSKKLDRAQAKRKKEKRG